MNQRWMNDNDRFLQTWMLSVSVTRKPHWGQGVRNFFQSKRVAMDYWKTNKFDRFS